MPDESSFPLTLLAGELRRRRLVEPVPPYRTLYHAILDGRIPAQQGSDGRWYWRNKDLPEIAAAFRRPAVAA
jgi:hypothetical protein